MRKLWKYWGFRGKSWNEYCLGYATRQPHKKIPSAIKLGLGIFRRIISINSSSSVCLGGCFRIDSPIFATPHGLAVVVTFDLRQETGQAGKMEILARTRKTMMAFILSGREDFLSGREDFLSRKNPF